MKKQETKSKTMEGASSGRNIDGTKRRSSDGSSCGMNGRSGNTSGGRSSYRNRRVTVRLTEGEFELVMRLAKRGNVVHGSGSTMSDVLRGLIFSSLSSLLVLMDGGMAERLVKSVTGNALRNGGNESFVDMDLEIREFFAECEQDGKEREWSGNVRERR